MFTGYQEPTIAYNQAAVQLETRFRQALSLHQQGRLVQAKVLYEDILRIQPNHFDALHFAGVIAAQTGHLQLAVDQMSKAIAINPTVAEVYSNRGNALRNLKQLNAALEDFERAISLNPDYPDAHYNRGIALSDLRLFDAAVACYDKVISLVPNHADAYDSRGCALHELRQFDAAVESYETATSLRPDFAEAYNNRGHALCALKQFDAALASCDKAIALKPALAEAYNNRGNALCALKQFDAALASCDKALSLKPDFAEAYNNRGNVLHELKRFEPALASYDNAIALNPDLADAYYNRGNALADRKRFDEAIASYDKATLLNPHYEFLQGLRFHLRMQICSWINFDIELTEMAAKIEREDAASSPFPILALSDSLSLQRKAATIFARQKFPINHLLPKIAKYSRHNRVRLGYFSADFHNHAISYLMAELFELHDRSQFEVIGFSFGPDINDEMRQRVSGSFDQFFDVRNQSDKDVAQLSRSLEIDLAIDLMGFTRSSRTGIFACRAAPVQVNYIGYPGTMSAEYIDYVIADRTLIPDKNQQYYTEKIVYLPNSYQVNDAKREIANSVPARREFGIPENAFVYCCFNSNYKITPSTFDRWMRILNEVGNSVLWLIDDGPLAAANLLREAQLRGVSGDRLIFAKRMKQSEHLARHRIADLFLDTLPYNAHTTASDALWAGLPVLTCCGESFASRVAASLLNAIGLPELITTTEGEYEHLAVELATSPGKLTGIREKLERNKRTTPLFNTPLFARHIEDAYTQMYERYQQNLPPEPIHVN